MRTSADVRGKVMGNVKVGGIFGKTTFKGNKVGYIISTFFLRLLNLFTSPE